MASREVQPIALQPAFNQIQGTLLTLLNQEVD